MAALAWLSAPLGFTPKRSGHCVRWEEAAPPSLLPTEAPGGLSPSHRDTEEGPILCREREAGRGAGGSACEATVAQVGRESSHLPLGVLASTGECVPLSQPMPAEPASLASLGEGEGWARGVELARADASCDVWWREVSEDVIPPIPELVLPLGSSPNGAKLALCRTFGEEGLDDGGVRRVGTLAVEGADFGKCFFTKADGSTASIDGGKFHVLQVPPPLPLLSLLPPSLSLSLLLPLPPKATRSDRL